MVRGRCNPSHKLFRGDVGRANGRHRFLEFAWDGVLPGMGTLAVSA